MTEPTYCCSAESCDVGVVTSSALAESDETSVSLDCTVATPDGCTTGEWSFGVMMVGESGSTTVGAGEGCV